MKALHMVTFILVIVGALNWGLVGIFDFNLVTWILGSVPAIERLVYILVGIAAIIEVATHKKTCKMCASSAPGNPAM